MLIVGERINCTRKKIGIAAREKDADFIKTEAIKQLEAGANMLDINGGIAGKEEALLPWLVEVVQEAVDLPLCLDSPNPEALRKAIPLCQKTPMINSITFEEERLQRLVPVVREHETDVIALCLSDQGTPQNTHDRVKIASDLINRLNSAGISREQIYVDPCVFPVSTSGEQGTAVLEAITQIRERFPEVHTICGVSNVSFGLPLRKLLNAVFLAMLMAKGLDSAIIDPCDYQTAITLKAANAILGSDDFCSEYLEAYRSGELELK